VSELTLMLTVLKEGAFAFGFKSVHFPDEIVVCRRGSPVLIGVKTQKKLKVDFVDVEFGTAAGTDEIETRKSTILCLLMGADPILDVSHWWPE
jgi:hypothetical protein